MYYVFEVKSGLKKAKVKKAKNAFRLAQDVVKMNYKKVKDYVDEKDSYAIKGRRIVLPCGIPFPLINMRTKRMYVVTEYEEIINYYNQDYISDEIIKEIKFINSFKGSHDGYY